MDDKETLNRRARLRELVSTCFDDRDTDLLDHIGRRKGRRPNQGEISGLQKDHGSRSFGDKKAKTLTDQIGLHRRWFDMPLKTNTQQSDWMKDELSPPDNADGNTHFAEEKTQDSAGYVGKAPRHALIAVSGFAKLGTNGWYEEISSPGVEGYVEASSSDPDAYVLRVNGDSMFPAIRNGWYVVAEPNRQPSPGEYAAIWLTDGRKMVKEFLFSNADGVSVQSVNGGERLSISCDEINVVHAIGSVLMPSKHRDI